MLKLPLSSTLSQTADNREERQEVTGRIAVAKGVSIELAAAADFVGQTQSITEGISVGK